MKTFWKKKNKYGAKKCRCNLNHIHDSAFEARYCNELLLRQKAGDIAEFETQKKFGKDYFSCFISFNFQYFSLFSI